MTEEYIVAAFGLVVLMLTWLVVLLGEARVYRLEGRVAELEKRVRAMR